MMQEYNHGRYKNINANSYTTLQPEFSLFWEKSVAEEEAIPEPATALISRDLRAAQLQEMLSFWSPNKSLFFSFQLVI